MISKRDSPLSVLNHVKQIKYQIDLLVYEIKVEHDGLIITIDDLKIKRRFTAITPVTLYTQDSLKSPFSLFDCFYKQYIKEKRGPKSMLSIETDEDVKLKVIFSYSNTPVKLLKFSCTSQVLPNSQLSPFKDAIQHMVSEAFDGYWKKIQPLIEKTQEKMIDEIRQQGYKWVTKLGYQKEEIIQMNKRCYEEIVFEKQTGIKQFKQHLQGLVDKSINSLQSANHKLIMEMVHKTAKLQKSLITIMNNQQQTYNKWQDIQKDLIFKVQTMNDELYRISKSFKQKLDTQGVSSLLVKLKLIQPSKQQQLLVKDTEKVDINMDFYTHNIHSMNIEQQIKQDLIDVKPIFSESTCFITIEP